MFTNYDNLQESLASLVLTVSLLIFFFWAGKVQYVLRLTCVQQYDGITNLIFVKITRKQDFVDLEIHVNFCMIVVITNTDGN